MHAPAAPSRLRSLDLVRGVVCVLMAIDHVRVYAGVPAGGPEPSIFFTRWITHFVAPAFCFLAGTGAFFMLRRLNDPGAVAKFLVTRGLWLVVLELTIIRFFWGFYVNPAQFSLAGVIWMLGWCMVLLALFVRMPAKRVGWIGVGIVPLQQLFGLVPRLLPEGARDGFGAFWGFIYNSPGEPAFGINVLYVIVPWVGVMMAGFGFGLVMSRDDETRRRLLYRIGLGMTAAFLVLATTAALVSGDGGGEDSGDGDGAPLWMRVLNQQKYPASQLFLLMTLGPTIALMPAAERARGWLADAMVTFGRVPMFYYLAHILFIHVAALIVNQIRIGANFGDAYRTAPYAQLPPDARWTLPILYLVWAIVVAGALYPVCRWYAGVKARRPDSWLRYI